MDYINILEEIVPKMRLQMHSNKNIKSLVDIVMNIMKFDPDHRGVCSVYFFSNFLASIGIYLKTQEISELLKYLELQAGLFSIDKFLELFKVEKDENLISRVTYVFEQMKTADDKIPLDILMSKINLKKHPIFQMFGNDEAYVMEKIKEEISFIIGDRDQVTLNDLIEFHCNLICVMPKERVNSFVNSIPDLWNCL